MLTTSTTTMNSDLLTDFGIARNLDDISGLTTTNTTVGTVAYFAPEQLMGEDVARRSVRPGRDRLSSADRLAPNVKRSTDDVAQTPLGQRVCRIVTVFTRRGRLDQWTGRRASCIRIHRA
jgi:serine/threonine protein kinase